MSFENLDYDIITVIFYIKINFFLGIIHKRHLQVKKK